MRTAVAYDPETGEILRCLRDHDDIIDASWFPAGAAVVYAGYRDDRRPWEEYVVDGAVVDRPTATVVVNKTQIAADGLDQAIIAGIPVGTAAKVFEAGEIYQFGVDDGQLEVEALEPGLIVVDLQPPFPYRKQRVVVEAI